MFSSTVRLNRLQKYLSAPLQEVSIQCADRTNEKAISCFGTFWSGQRLTIDGRWAFRIENPGWSLWQNSKTCWEKFYTVSNTRRHCWQKRVTMITARASPALNPYLQNRINQCVAFVLQIDCQSSCSISPSPASIQIELDIFERFWDFVSRLYRRQQAWDCRDASHDIDGRLSSRTRSDCLRTWCGRKFLMREKSFGGGRGWAVPCRKHLVVNGSHL